MYILFLAHYVRMNGGSIYFTDDKTIISKFTDYKFL